MKASIIVALDSNLNFTDNFLYFLSQYKNIEQYELIFTSDGNNDVNYKKSICRFFDNYKYIEHKAKMGYGVVNNIAANKTSTDILIFMNADIILEPKCLEHLILSLESKDAQAVQPLLIYPQTMQVQSTGHIFCNYYNTHMFENRSINDIIVNKPGFRNAFTTALCAVYKKEFFKHGGFDEKYFNAWEGMELGLKIVSNGGKCYYEPSAKAYHIRGGGRGQYKIDETPQTAYFWSKWGNVIKENLSQVINEQIYDIDKEEQYILINFSCIRDFKYIIEKLNINVIEFLNYTEYAGNKSIEFFKTLPYSLLNLDCNIVYLANNYSYIIKNSLWYSLREKYNDIIIDLAGNCLKL
jgi:GT2 family glycosyltransferase